MSFLLKIVSKIFNFFMVLFLPLASEAQIYTGFFFVHAVAFMIFIIIIIPFRTNWIGLHL